MINLIEFVEFWKEGGKYIIENILASISAKVKAGSEYILEVLLSVNFQKQIGDIALYLSN